MTGRPPPDDPWVVRVAGPDDVPAICRFGATHVPPHYAPLIGARAAEAQVTRWWSAAHVGAAVAEARVVVADTHGGIVGVAQLGRDGAEHVLYKLYVGPGHRGRGLGPDLVAAVVRLLPPGTRRLSVEHFSGNARAGAFYEREGFTVDRVDPSPFGDPALDVVWRSRDVEVADRPW